MRHTIKNRHRQFPGTAAGWQASKKKWPVSIKQWVSSCITKTFAEVTITITIIIINRVTKVVADHGFEGGG